MHLPRIVSTFRFVSTAFEKSSLPLAARPRISFSKPPIPTHIRYATHKASKASNGAKDGPGKRLGAKKTTGEKVRVGMIIYRQRGTIWHPGENAGMGRDHTIYALKPGYVRYYKDLKNHPRRQFIGIALNPTQLLPKPANAARTRRLGMVPVPLYERPRNIIEPGTPLTREESYKVSEGSYIPRPANWRIGKVMPKLVRKKVRSESRRKSIRKKEVAIKKRK